MKKAWWCEGFTVVKTLHDSRDTEVLEIIAKNVTIKVSLFFFTVIVTDISSTHKHTTITLGNETMKKPVSQDYKSWRNGISLSRYLERPRLKRNIQVWMTVSSAHLRQLILDQQIFHCSSIAKSLLYSTELSCRYCVCTHSLERNPILRSNPQAE